MGTGGGAAAARRPFIRPSLLNALLGSPHGPAALPPSAEEEGDGGRGSGCDEAEGG